MPRTMLVSRGSPFERTTRTLDKSLQHLIHMHLTALQSAALAHKGQGTHRATLAPSAFGAISAVAERRTHEHAHLLGMGSACQLVPEQPQLRGAQAAAAGSSAVTRRAAQEPELCSPAALCSSPGVDTMHKCSRP